MYAFLAQSADTTNSLDLGEYTQSLFKALVGVDVMLVFRVMIVWFFIIWLVFALWVAVDAVNRYKEWPMALIWFIFVLPFNVLGFIGYLFMRPVVTLEEKQWTKLESKYLMYELSSVNDCPSCHTLVPVGHNYCAVCGTQMNVNCPQCDTLQSIYNGFCSSCGKKLTPEEKKVVEEAVEMKPVVSDKKKSTVVERINGLMGRIKSSLTATTQAVSKSLSAKKNSKVEKKESNEKKESTESKKS